MAITEKDNARLQAFAQKYPRLFRGVILPWFPAEGWPKMLKAAADRDNLFDTFQEFEQASDAKYTELTAKGHPVEKVVVDADALIAWCRTEGRPLNGMARQEFAMLSVIERDKRAGHA